MKPIVPSTTATTTRPPTTGFSLSPGGLLLPYHVGCLEALDDNGQLTQLTPLGGSSAGGIAVAAHACGVSPGQVIDATAQIAQECEREGGTRGRLLRKLRGALEDLITESQFQQFRERPGPVTIAYQQVLPQWKSMHLTQQDLNDANQLIDTICHSSSFPFFTTNWPVVYSQGRLVVDGYFAVSRDRFGCPCFDTAGVEVDRTVMISVFPQTSIGLKAVSSQNCISPAVELMNDNSEEEEEEPQMVKLLRLATQASTAKDYAAMYEAGYQDAEQWCQKEQQSTHLKNNRNKHHQK